MSRRHKSREQWEQELWDSQQNNLTEDGIGSAGRMARRGGSVPLIHGPLQLLLLLVGAILLVSGAILIHLSIVLAIFCAACGLVLVAVALSASPLWRGRSRNK
jgi:hypothetical protein